MQEIVIDIEIYSTIVPLASVSDDRFLTIFDHIDNSIFESALTTLVI